MPNPSKESARGHENAGGIRVGTPYKFGLTFIDIRVPTSTQGDLLAQQHSTAAARGRGRLDGQMDRHVTLRMSLEDRRRFQMVPYDCVAEEDA